jgi:hypothetical protein
MSLSSGSRRRATPSSSRSPRCAPTPRG